MTSNWSLAVGDAARNSPENSQRFPLDELGHGSLQVHLKSCSHSEEDEGKSLGPTFLPPAHYGGLK